MSEGKYIRLSRVRLSKINQLQTVLKQLQAEKDNWIRVAEREGQEKGLVQAEVEELKKKITVLAGLEAKIKVLKEKITNFERFITTFPKPIGSAD